MLVDCIRNAQSLVRGVWTSSNNMTFLEKLPNRRVSELLDVYAHDALKTLELRLYELSEAADHLFDRYHLRKESWFRSGFKSWNNIPPKFKYKWSDHILNEITKMQTNKY
jgi:RimJ/RimL family protein N-acetyltransferase